MYKILATSALSVLPTAAVLMALGINCGRANVGDQDIQESQEPEAAVPATGSADLTLTILFDNYAHTPGLQTGWGFSCLVRGTEKTVLFDTGADGRILLANMRKLKLDPGQVDTVVLSHVHWDHVGGLPEFLEANSHVTVYLPRSFPEDFITEVERSGAQVVKVDQPVEVCRNVYTTGEMGTAIIEQSLVIETQQGLVVITGCAHPGIVNIARRAHELRQKPLYLVLGGFHLKDYSASEIEQVIRELKQLQVRVAAPSHCSGNLARSLFQESFGEHYMAVGVGKAIVIEDAFAHRANG